MLQDRERGGGRSRALVVLLGAALIQLVSSCVAEAPPPEAEGGEPETGEVAQATVGTQGVGFQGVGFQGVGFQGVGFQGAFSGAAFNGKIPSGYQLGKALQNTDGHFPGYPRWYFPNATALVQASTLSTIAPSAASPFYLTGVVRPTPGVPFTGVSGDTVNLRLVAHRAADATSNLFALPPVNPFAPPDARSNADVTLYQVEWQTGPSTWQSVCPLGGEGVVGQDTGSGQGWAMFVRGTYDATGRASELTTNKSVVPGAGAEFTIACTNGAVAKCARQWGYKPWKSAPNQRNGGEHDLRPYHQMCLRAARADYCADGRSFTVDGTLIDMADSRGFVQRESEQSPSYSFAGESVFTTNIGSGSPEGRAWCLMRSRFEENASAITCATKPIYNLNSCFPYYGDTYFTNDPSNGVYDMVWAGTKSYCSHKTSEVGGRLAADCNQCTRRVCDAASEGSASSLGGTQWASSSPTAGDSYCCRTSWDSLCVSEAAAWCTPSEWSNRNEFGAWKAGEPPALEADWYALKGPNGEIRWDFPGIVRDYGPLGTAPFGTPAGFPANSGARWVGHNVTTQESDYFRYRFRGWKTGTVNVYVAAYDEFKVYVDGVFLGGGAAPGVASVYSAPTVDGKEHLVAVSTKKAGGGGVFALDIR